MKRIFLIILPLLSLLFAACGNSSTTTTPSSEAQLKAFSFAVVDSIPGLQSSTFIIKELQDTGYVCNQDSLTFGTSLAHVVPKFTFTATPSSVVLRMQDTTIVLTGKDTVNFSAENQPAYLTVRSADGTKTKVYKIEVFVHQVDPDLYQWRRLTEAVYPADDSEQNTLCLGSTFCLFASDGLSTRLYTSENGREWGAAAVPVGLPSLCHVRGMVSDGTTLYYADSTHVYYSADARNWMAQDYASAAFRIHSMLMSFNDYVWAVVEDKATAELYLARVESGALVMTDITLADRFPVGDFAAVEFQSSSLRSRALILGGYSRMGQSLNTRWSIEYSAAEDRYRICDYTIEQPSFTSLTGASMVSYDDKLFLFGGVNEDALLSDKPILYSVDEGMHWLAPDSTKNALPAEYELRQQQSALVRDNNIYLFGGQSRTATYSDVYCGRLNSIDWEKK